MANKVGYVKLWRSVLDWEWYHDLPSRVLLLHLMVTVNREPKRFEGRVIEPGSIATSLESLAKSSGLTIRAVRTALGKLKNTGEIGDEATNRFRVISLRKWEEYQEGAEKKAGRRQANDKQMTGERQADDGRATTTKEVEKERSKEVRGARAVVSMSFDEFRTECLAVHRSEKILTNDQSKAFFDYWTEGHPTTKPRYARKDVFDIAKRMRTWASKENGHATQPDKPSTLKPWVN